MDVVGVKLCGTERLGLVWLLEWSPQVVPLPQFPMCPGKIIAFFSPWSLMNGKCMCHSSAISH